MVTLRSAGAQQLYNKIERVVIYKGVDLIDIPNWEFWFDGQIVGKNNRLFTTSFQSNTPLACCGVRQRNFDFENAYVLVFYENHKWKLARSEDLAKTKLIQVKL